MRLHAMHVPADTAAGCAKAPRGCPGTHLALFLAQKVVEFVVAGMEEESAAAGKADWQVVVDLMN